MEEGTTQDKEVRPAELLMKRKLRTKLDLVVTDTASLVRQKQNPVFIKDFSSPKSWQKGTVVQKTGSVSVGLLDGRVVRRHQDHTQRSHRQAQQSQILRLWYQEWVPRQLDCTTYSTQPSSPTKPVMSWSDIQEDKPLCPVCD